MSPMLSDRELELVKEYRALQAILDSERRPMSVRELARLSELRRRLGVEPPGQAGQRAA